MIREYNQMIFYNECGIVVRRSEYTDCGWLASKLSEAESDEAWALCHQRPIDLLIESQDNSDLCLTIEHQGEMVGMFGVMKSDKLATGIIWFIATDEIKNMGRIFLRRAKDFISLMHEHYPMLENYVHSKNKASILWMRFAGAKVNDPIPYGVEGELFHKFEFNKSTVTIPSRQKILDVEKMITALPEAMVGDCFPLKHSFAKGTYVREIAIPKGMVVVSKIHKHSHPVFVLKGEISIYTEEGVKRIKAPCSFISPAGAKRVGITHEDTVWVTVHSTNETNLERIEEELIAKNFEEFNDQEIKNFVEEVLLKEGICHSSLLP